MSCCTPPLRAQHGPQAPHPRAKPLAWWRLIGGAVLAGNIMTLSLATNLSSEPGQSRLVLHLVLCALTSVVALLLGGPLWQRLLELGRAGAVDIEVLFVLAAAAAGIFSLYNTLHGGNEVYFEVVAILLVVYSLSQRLKVDVQARVEAKLVEDLLLEARAHVLAADGKLMLVDVAAVRQGQLVQIHEGATVPVDGQVEQGRAVVEILALTGEPFGQTVGVGDLLRATSVVVEGSLLVRATRDGRAREVDAVAALVRGAIAKRESAERGRAPPKTALLVARLVQIFVPAVVAASAGTFLFWWQRLGAATGLLYALAVVLVACPCALGFAIPLGMRLGVLTLARLGISVRNFAAMERMAKVTRILFDKTGTLTRVQVDPAQLVPLPCGEPDVPGDGDAQAGFPSDIALSPSELYGLAAAIERLIDHPIAKAFVLSAKRMPSPWQIEWARALPGRGVEAHCVTQAGRQHRVVLGESARMPAVDGPPSPAGRERPIAMHIDGHVVAMVELHEQPLADLDQLHSDLAALDIDMMVLSGDRAERVARLGLASAVGGLSAQQKGSIVARESTLGRTTCVVGDGVNDAVALAEASVGVAIAGGSSLAREVADIVLPAGKPEAILDVVKICRTTYRSVRSNVAIAVAYNAVGMSLAATGYLTPIVAAILMMASSLSVSARMLWQHQRQIRASDAAHPDLPTGPPVRQAGALA